MLRNPYFLGGPQRQAQGVIQKWLPHPCLVGGPQEGGSATEPLHSQRNPCIPRGPQRQAPGGIQKWLPHP